MLEAPLAHRRARWPRPKLIVQLACAGAFAGLTLGAGSCGSTSSSAVTATGTTLTIYASTPADVPEAQDFYDAEALAFSQEGSRVGKYQLRLKRLTGTKVSDNARTAIEDNSAIAYIGELSPGSSADTIGITNAEDLLQVSPADTAIELTQATSAVPGAPGNYYEARGTYGSTFARVVPSAALEAKAQAQEMAAMHVSSVYVTSDGSPYGAAIAAALKSDAAAGGITVASSQSGASAIFYGGVATSASKFAGLAQQNPTVKVFGPSSFASATPPSSPNAYVSAPGFLASKLPAAAQSFVSAFTSAYGHPPATGAIFGYEAVKAVIDVLREAGASANDRSTVVRDFFAIRNRSSAIGTYSIDSAGDPTIGPFVFSRLHDGQLVPFRFVQVAG